MKTKGQKSLFNRGLLMKFALQPSGMDRYNR
jgi:hypothetical protein